MGGGGDDKFFIYGMGDNTSAVVYGDIGNDELVVDGTGNSSILSNALDSNTIEWSGGNGDDAIYAVFASTGSSNIDLFDDTEGVNTLDIQCANFSTNILSRENFL